MAEAKRIERVKDKHGGQADRILQVVRYAFPNGKPVDLWQQIRLILSGPKDAAIVQAALKAELGKKP